MLVFACKIQGAYHEIHTADIPASFLYVVILRSSWYSSGIFYVWARENLHKGYP